MRRSAGLVTVMITPTKAPTRAATPHDEIVMDRFLTIDVSTAELADMEAALVYRQVEHLELSSAESYRLEAIERELNRRWALHYGKVERCSACPSRTSPSSTVGRNGLLI